MRRNYVGKHVRGQLAASVRQGRRETIYKMAAKRHNGTVPCFVCKLHVTPDAATLEHIVPRSKGGTDDMSNLAISHSKCNNQRGNSR